jgi:lipoprotein-anchoring transpeptidase ErfK/SrfK
MKKLLVIAIILFCALPLVSKAAPVDTDRDGLIDDQEIKFKTNPNLPDTDGDGYVDGLEITKGFDPLSAEAKQLTKSILIDTKKQELYQQLNGITIRTHTVSTGKASMPSPKGTFTIANKAVRAWSKMYGLWMPYWMGISGTRAGIHELPEWPNGYKEGAKHLGIPVSHGCVRLGVEAAKIVYDWTPVGTKVTIK